MGSWLVDELISRGHEVTSVDNLMGGYMRNVSKECLFVKMDVRDGAKVDGVVKGKDVVYHLAAYAAEGQSFFSPVAINDINITPMNNILVSAVNHGVRRVVFTSSMAVYGEQKPPFDEDMPCQPADPYGAAKEYCETVLRIFSQVHGIEHVVIRPHNVFGPRQNTADPYRNVLGIWINRIMRGLPPLIYGDGRQTRAFSYIEDVTPAIANAGLNRKAVGETINVGSDEVHSVNDAARQAILAMKVKMKPEHLPERPGEVKHAFSTVEKSEELLDYRTRHTLRQGLEEMCDWAKALGPQEPTYTLPLEITKGAPPVWLRRAM